MSIASVVDELPVALVSVNRKDIENIAFPPKICLLKALLTKSRMFYSENLKYQF